MGNLTSLIPPKVSHQSNPPSPQSYYASPSSTWLRSFFFFQAEDGIRDGHVTGVQTCALPIFFPVFFTTVIVGDADQDFRLGNLLWSVSLAVSYFMVVLSGPVLGAIMDYSALKKRDRKSVV